MKSNGNLNDLKWGFPLTFKEHCIEEMLKGMTGLPSELKGDCSGLTLRPRGIGREFKGDFLCNLRVLPLELKGIWSGIPLQVNGI